MRQRAADLREFFRQFRREFEATGAVAPSGPFLAKAITKPLREFSGPKRILEIGPGTGALTNRIVDYLEDGDQFDLVEINESFAAHLEQRFETCPRYKRVASLARVHCSPLQDYTSDEGLGSYDAVISGLPLNNFSPNLVTELIDSALQHVRPGGYFSMFEYMYVRPIRSRIGAKTTRERMKAIEAIMQERFDRHDAQTDWVFPNVLPAWVQHLKVDEAAAPAVGQASKSSDRAASKVTTS